MTEAVWSVDAALGVVREAMEGLLVPEKVSEILFEAALEFADLPRDRVEFQAFVDGPLRRALIQSVGEAGAEAVLSRARVAAPSSKEQYLGFEDFPDPHEYPTEALNLGRSTACVLVFASSPSLERGLRVAMGSELVVFTASSQVDLHASLLARTPRLVVIDARDPGGVDASELGQIFAYLRADAFIVVWHAENEYGQRVGEVLSQENLPVVRIDAQHGTEPLLDVVRSHGMGRPSAFDMAGETSPPPPPEDIVDSIEEIEEIEFDLDLAEAEPEPAPEPEPEEELPLVPGRGVSRRPEGLPPKATMRGPLPAAVRDAIETLDARERTEERPAAPIAPPKLAMPPPKARVVVPKPRP